ncbi:hypothetical protein HMPREF6745_0682 [Prevotella sp. oral taxon 472 str. F0295]|nr:hypothetical protein HMPREF6745_0682 [Prevotella sp. oral taxon 472 str. F0295]
MIVICFLFYDAKLQLFAQTAKKKNMFFIIKPLLLTLIKCVCVRTQR